MKKIILPAVLISCFSAKVQRLISGYQYLGVVVEITGRDTHSKRHAEPVLYAKVKLQNKSNRTRRISTMTCSWEESWVSKGSYGFCYDGCDKNVETEIDIPVGQTLVFYGRLCRGSGNKLASSHANSGGTRLGFMDFKLADFGDQSKIVRVYWSNEFTDKQTLNTRPHNLANGPYYELSKTSN